MDIVKFQHDVAIPLATSRYQVSALIVRSGLVPVRITLGSPRFRLGYQLGGRIPCLYPGRQLFALEDASAFEEAYRAELERVGLDMISHEVALISAAHGGAGLVLLCFEDVFRLGEGSCHRRMFANWWAERTGEDVPELTWEEPETR